MENLGIERTRNAVSQMAYRAVWILKYHLFFSAPPALALSLAVQGVKGISAQTRFAEFPTLRSKLRRGHLWAPSFSLSTAGQVSAETIKRDIERTAPGRARR